MNALNWSQFGWAIALVAAVSQGALAFDGRPSSETLAAMGLGGLAIVSDEDALSIRGQGFKGGSSVRVFGNSFATFNAGSLGGAHSENGYVAEGKHFASGKNRSEAGVKITVSKGKGQKGGMNSHSRKSSKWRPGGGKPGGHGMPSKSITIKFFAGGSSSAKAF
jgi:hypothetical protein